MVRSAQTTYCAARRRRRRTNPPAPEATPPSASSPNCHAFGNVSPVGTEIGTD